MCVSCHGSPAGRRVCAVGKVLDDECGFLFKNSAVYEFNLPTNADTERRPTLYRVTDKANRHPGLKMPSFY